MSGYDFKLSATSYGTIDYIQYWSGNTLWSERKNPYDPKEMFELQNKIGHQDQEPTMMWNPPWILPFLSLLVGDSFETSAWNWLIFNIFITFFSIFVFAYVMRFSANTLTLSIISSFLFLPLHTSFSFGQTGSILLFGSVLYFIGIRNRIFTLEGFGLLILSLKPHVLYLLIVYRYLLLIKNRDFVYLFKISLIPFSFIFAFYLTNPLTINQWLTSLFGDQSNELAVKDWIVVSLTGFLRNISYMISGNSAQWLMKVVPLSAVIVLPLIESKKLIPQKVEEYFPYLATASLFFNPYGWLSDSSCLLLLPLLLFSYANQKTVRISPKAPEKNLLLCQKLLLFQIASLPFAILFSDKQHWLFLYPPILLFVFCVLKRDFTKTQ